MNSQKKATTHVDHVLSSHCLAEYHANGPPFASLKQQLFEEVEKVTGPSGASWQRFGGKGF